MPASLFRLLNQISIAFHLDASGRGFIDVLCVVVEIGHGAAGADRSPFSKSVLTCGEQKSIRFSNNDADQLVAFSEFDPADASRGAAHRAGIRVRKTNRHAARRCQHHVIARSDDDNVDQLVAFFQTDGDQAARLRPTVLCQHGLFHNAVSSGHQ